MTMLSFTPLSNYDASILRLIGAIEAPHLDARDVGDKKVTIGLGFNLNAKDKVRDAVIKALLGEPSGAGSAAQIALEASYRGSLVDAIGASNLSGTQKIARLNTIMAERAANTALNGYINNRRSSFTFVSIAAVNDMFTNSVKALYEADLKRVFPALKQGTVLDAPYLAEFAGSREHAVLFSLVYNGGPGLVGENLRAAISSGDRARAWYELRYQSNGLGWHQINGTGSPAQRQEITNGNDKGLAKRRYLESQVFGLYASSEATESEARDSFRMLTKYRAEIFKYEAAYGTKRDGTKGSRGDFVAASAIDYLAVQDIAVAQPLIDVLEVAKTRLLTDLRGRYGAYSDQLVSANFLATNIYLATAGVAANLDSNRFEEGIFAASDKRDLLIGDSKGDLIRGNLGNDVLVGEAGNDLLEGGAGADLLIGGADDDVLRGGAGDDTLDGGDGDDIYVIDLRDGSQHDRIVDSDHMGRIVIIGTDGLTLETINYERVDPGTNMWTSDDGSVKLSHNSPWKLTLPDGSIIELGEGFDPSGFGMNLTDNPDEPKTTYTGDFKKKTNPAGNKFEFAAGDAANYASDGEQIGAADQITGSSGADIILGLAGDDALLGREGDDSIEGGVGSDVIQGGLGADTLNGGDGEDVIYGSSMGRLENPTETDFVPPVQIYPTLLGNGFNWKNLADGVDGDGIARTYLSNSVARDFQAGDESNTIDAGAGDDAVYAGTGNDVVHGRTGNDDIYGMGGGDVLFGDDGNDRIAGDATVVIVADLVVYAPGITHGEDLLDGGAGNDTLLGQGGDDQLFGGTGNDFLWGDDRSAADTPAEFHGDDYLDGGAGNDQLVGGGGNDLLDGGAGNDAIFGDHDDSSVAPGGVNGSDTLYGGAGDDYLSGNRGNDRLDGESGDDFLDGGDGDDTLVGGAGTDVLKGGAGNDTYVFTSGESPLTSGGLSEYVDDLEGSNTVIWSGSAPIFVTVSVNLLVLGFDGGDRIVVRGGASGSVANYEFGGSRYSFTSLLGQFSNDPTYGTNADGQTLAIGGRANDSLTSAHANSMFFGGYGDDVLQGSGGFNTYVFGIGGGVDTIIDTSVKTDADGNVRLNTLKFEEGIFASDIQVSHNGALVLTVGQGGDAVRIEGADLIDPQAATPIDRFEFADGTVLSYAQLVATGIDYQGTGGYDVLVGQAGNDSINGLGGNDNIFGHSGNDVLNGGSGDDTLWGGDGVDTLVGGDDDDYLYGEADNDVLDGSEGDDTLNGGAGNNTYVFGIGDARDQIISTFDTALGRINAVQFEAGIQAADVSVDRSDMDLTLTINGTSDQLTVRNFFRNDDPGTAYFNPIQQVKFVDGTTWDVAAINANALAGNDTSEVLIGYQGSDSIAGMAGNDVLLGHQGNDTLNGGQGDDTLDGGSGDDTLDGGVGDDVYVYRAGDGSDVIADSDAALGSQDTLKFGTSIQSTDIQFDVGQTGTDLILRVLGTNESITLTNWLGSRKSSIDKFEFSSGLTWDTAYVLQKVTVTHSGDDSGELFSGTTAPDVIHAGAGDDTLYGLAGNDVLDSGKGDDVLDGGEGFDTFLFAAGDGIDFVHDADGTGVIRFDASVSPADVDVYSNGMNWNSEGVSYALRYGSNSMVYVREWWLDGLKHLVRRVEFADGTVWSGEALQIPTSKGTQYNDNMLGTSGSDLFDGGRGDDSLEGRQGSDTYVYRAGDGNDRIDDSDMAISSIDTLKFHSSVQPEDVRLFRQFQTDDIVVRITTTGEEITLSGWVGSGGTSIDAIEFSDGTVWNRADIQSRFTAGTGSDDYLDGTGLNDRLQGFDGNDTLYGSQGDDTLEGGEGADWLSGGDGNDTYAFQPGFGRDFISEDEWEGGLENNLVVLHGVAPTDVRVSRDESSLYLLVKGSDDSVCLESWFVEDGDQWIYKSFKVQFDDGTIWDSVALTSRLDSLQVSNNSDVWFGTEGNDTVSALGGDDRVDGRDGDDVLEGGDGDDTLVGGLGINWLRGDAGEDDLMGGDGVNLLDGGSGNDSLTTDWGKALLLGGDGNDGIDTYASTGGQLVLFNDGDGNDVFRQADADDDRDVISLGGGLALQDVTFRVDNNEDGVRLLLGSGGSILLSNWIGGPWWSNGAARALTLQVIDNGTISTFDLSASLAEFAAVYAANPEVGEWSASASLSAHQLSTSTSMAFGGELANRYATQGSLDGESAATVRAALSAVGSGPTSILGEQAEITGTAGADDLIGTSADDMINALGGDDRVYGAGGNDRLDGGEGDDVLSGGLGADTYVYTAGWGRDTIDDLQNGLGQVPGVTLSDDGLIDEIVFDATVNKDSLTYRIENGSLVIARAASGDEILIQGSLDPASAPIERARFADGSTLTIAQMLALVVETPEPRNSISGLMVGEWLSGSSGDDVINSLSGDDIADGLEGDDMLDGGMGIDQLSGGAGSDTLIGGADDDELSGGEGADTYIFAGAFGKDVIHDAEGHSTIRMRGVDPSQIVVSRDLESLYLIVDATSNRLQLDGWFADQAQDFSVVFDDGTTWSATHLEAQMTPQHGTQGEDVLFGGASSSNDHLVGLGGADLINGGLGDDEIDGGEGDDLLLGGKGSDVYVYGAGDGNDRIRESQGQGDVALDVLRFDSSIQPADIRVALESQWGYIKLYVASTGEAITLDSWLYMKDSHIDQVEFSNGTVWDRSEIRRLLGLGTEGDDLLVATSGNDSITGLAGNDYLWSFDTGSYTFEGGAGDDLIQGGAGDETYVFRPGFGADNILEVSRFTGAGNNKIRLHGLSPSDVQVSRTYTDLVLLVQGTEDRITLGSWFRDIDGLPIGPQFAVEFDDGTIWSNDSLESRIDARQVSANSDVWYGTTDGDSVNALDGNDQLDGGEGADVLDGGAGNDWLVGGSGINWLKGGAGNDELRVDADTNLLDGGAGNDRLNVDLGASLLIGGGGDDMLFAYGTMAGQVILFNSGDGDDTFGQSVADSYRDVISLGGGLSLQDVRFQAEGELNVRVLLGSGGSILLEHWAGSPLWPNAAHQESDGGFAFPSEATRDLTLQVIQTDAINTYDLSASLAEFAVLYKANPQIGEWSAGASLLEHQLSTSTDQAFGGELAYRYATQGSLDSEGVTAVHDILSSASFGVEPTSVVLEPAMLASQSSNWTSLPDSAWRSSAHAQSLVSAMAAFSPASAIEAGHMLHGNLRSSTSMFAVSATQ